VAERNGGKYMDKLEKIKKEYYFYQKVCKVLYKHPKKNKKLIKIVNTYMDIYEEDYNYFSRIRRNY
jgi:hypothetical protein